MEGPYYIINSDRKAELYLGYNEYKALPATQQKEIKSFFLFSRSKGAWISKGGYNNYSVIRILEALKLPLKGREERKTFEEKQAQKVDRAENRIDRFEKYSQNAEKRAVQLQAEFNKLRKDWSWITQPIIAGHSGSQRFARSKERVMNRYDKGFEEYAKSDYYKNRAESSRDTAEQTRLKDASYLQKQIKEANTTISKVSKWVESYQNKDRSRLIEQYGEEKINNWILDGIEKLQEAYEKLAYFSFYLDKLKNSGTKVYDPETLKNAEYVKIRGRWMKVIRLNPTTITHSWFVGSYKHPYNEVQDAVYKNDSFTISPGRIKGDFIITRTEKKPEPEKKPWKAPEVKHTGKKINWKAKLSDKQKTALSKGIVLMEKAKKLQKESGTIEKTVYKVPIQKALKIVAKN